MAGPCAGSNFPNCSTNHTYIQPDPDIAGIGVVVSFVISAAMTLAMSMIGIVLNSLPRKLQEHGNRILLDASATDVNQDASTSSDRPSVDATDATNDKAGPRKNSNRHRFDITDEKREYWATVIERFVLGLADQQLVTGTAILLVGLMKCDMTVYHFTILNDLAWLSSNTHLTAMSIISNYLREYPAARSWRVLVMILMAVLLLVSTLFVYHQDWDNSLPAPAYCLFQTIRGNIKASDSAANMTLEYTLLIYGYASTIIPLYPSLRLAVRKRWDRFIKRPVKAAFDRVGGRSILNLNYGATLVKGISFLTSGPLLNLCFDTFWFTRSTISLSRDRQAGAVQMDPSSSDYQSAWGFGQMVPLFLIFLPILTMIEIFYEETREFTARKESRLASNLVKPPGSQHDSLASNNDRNDIALNEQHNQPSATQPDPDPDSEDYQPSSARRADTEMRVGIEPGSSVSLGANLSRASSLPRPLDRQGGESYNIEYPVNSLERRTTRFKLAEASEL